jgi:hypothetical protein
MVECLSALGAAVVSRPGMASIVTTRASQNTGLSPSDYHHSRLTCRDAYIDECTIMDAEEGSHATIVRWSDRVQINHPDSVGLRSSKSQFAHELRRE